MKTLKVTLKQHTPLIHFQHDQYGATLRASEVKPKLDKFILGKLGYGIYADGTKEAKANGWLIGKGEHPALDYKLKIKTKGERLDYLVASSLSTKEQESLDKKGVIYIAASPYFAQEKENKNIVKGIVPFDSIRCKGILFSQVELDIADFHRSNNIVDVVANNIQAFFASENFGVRQNKGFGCFTVESIKIIETGTEKTVTLKPIEEIFKDNFIIRYKKQIKESSLSGIFSMITNDYKLLKSGQRNPYTKSKLMLYGLGKHQRWEKKFLKENIDEVYYNINNQLYKLKSTVCNSNTCIDENEGFYYLRALLGVANQYEFLLDNPPAPYKKMVVTVKGHNVDRFKSPILFKVIDGVVYLLGNEISPEILNKQFSFFVNIQGDSGYKDDKIEDDLYTPQEFSLKKFMEFAMKGGSGAKVQYVKF